MLATQAYLLVPSCRMLIGALLPFGDLLLNVDRGPYYLFSALLMISGLRPLNHWHYPADHSPSTYWRPPLIAALLSFIYL